MATAQQIIADINAHMQQSGIPNNRWYIGIAANARNRLFVDHGVNEQGGWWILRQADSSAIARQVEKAYLDAGCQGGGGGGDDTTVWVYAYVITSDTRE